MRTEVGDVLAGRYCMAYQLPGTEARPMWEAVDEWSERSVLLAHVPTPTDSPARGAAVRRVVGREVRVATGLPRHPHLRHVLDVVHDDQAGLWVVSETQSCTRPLAEVLNDSGPVEPGRVARCGRDLADGLAALHALNLVHREIRPGLGAIGNDGAAVLLGVAATGDRSPEVGATPGGPGEKGELGAGDVRALASMLREKPAPVTVGGNGAGTLTAVDLV